MEYVTKKTTDGKIVYYRNGTRIAKSKILKKYWIESKRSKETPNSIKRKISNRKALCDQHRFSLLIWPFQISEKDQIKLTKIFGSWQEFIDYDNRGDIYVLTLIHYVKDSEVWDMASINDINEEEEIIKSNTLVLIYLHNNGDANTVGKIVINNVPRSLDTKIYSYLKKSTNSLGF